MFELSAYVALSIFHKKPSLLLCLSTFPTVVEVTAFIA